MNKYKLAVIFVLAIILISGGLIIFCNSKNTKSPSVFDAKNSSFTIDDSKITLVNGEYRTEITPGSASKNIIKYFGNEASGDLNSDGLPDTAFLITQNTGGSGIFYYVVVALRTSDGYKTTNAFFIGDRIAPQTTEINSVAKELYVNYADRKPGEPFTVQPSQGKTLVLKITPNEVLEGLMK